MKDLFLHADGGAPVLERMATERAFVDALRSFETRTAYCNLDNDLMVGFETSALMRDAQRPAAPPAGAVGVVGEDAAGPPGAHPEGGEPGAPAHRRIIDALGRLDWRRVHVSFSGTRIPGLAHTHIQVSRPWLNGAGVQPQPASDRTV